MKCWYRDAIGYIKIDFRLTLGRFVDVEQRAHMNNTGPHCGDTHKAPPTMAHCEQFHICKTTQIPSLSSVAQVTNQQS